MLTPWRVFIGPTAADEATKEKTSPPASPYRFPGNWHVVIPRRVSIGPTAAAGKTETVFFCIKCARAQVSVSLQVQACSYMRLAIHFRRVGR